MRARFITGLTVSLLVAAASTAGASQTGVRGYGANATGKPRAPKVFTQAAEVESTTEAVVNGLIDSDGLPAHYRFQLGLTKSYGRHGPFLLIELEDAGERFLYPAEALEDLRPGTTYHYRLVAYTAGGKSYGRDRTFHTQGR